MDIGRWKIERGGILTRWIYAFAFKVDGVGFINYFLWIKKKKKRERNDKNKWLGEEMERVI